MKSLPTLLAALLLAAATTHGALYPSGTLNAPIPDGNPAGFSSTISLSGLSLVTDVNVVINTSGGVNGDLYAYLSHGGGSVVLLNRIGKTSSAPFGSTTIGLGSSGDLTSFRLDDSGAADIHGYSGGSPITGTYQADGRTADSLSVLDTSSRGPSFASFNGGAANGDWTIFFADMAGGNGSPTLVSWGLEVTAVPEPVNVALGIFGGVFVLVILARSQPVRDRVRLWRAAFVQWVDAV